MARGRRQVGDPGVEPRAGAQGVGEDAVEGAISRRRSSRLFWFLSSTLTTAWRLLSAGLRSARDCLTSSGQLGGELAGGDQQLCTASRRATSARSRTSLSFISVDDVLVTVGEDAGDLLKVAEQGVRAGRCGGDVRRERGEALAACSGTPPGCSWSASARVLIDLASWSGSIVSARSARP